MNSHFSRFDKLNVDENQAIIDKTCTFKGAYKYLTNLNLTNQTDLSNSSNFFDVKISLRTVTLLIVLL